MDTRRLLVHPVRLRIVGSLSGRELTRRELERLIPEVPSPSLYRNLRLLIEAGVVVTVRKIPRRGAEEHVYAMAEGGGWVSREEAAGWSRDDWQQGLDSFLQGISASYRSYLEAGGGESCPASGRVFRLTDEQRDRLAEEVGAVFARYAQLPEAAAGRRYVVSIVYQPDEPG